MSRVQSQNAPIAVIGMSCRFPGGANNPDQFWSILRDKKDCISEVPASRFDIDQFYDAQGKDNKSYTRYGGFLKDYDPESFDAGFFKMSPREARELDPQQRLLLELSVEAAENAFVPLESLKGTKTGVYVGISSNDYSGAHYFSGQLDKLGTYSMLGSMMNTASGRVSYYLGLEGPSLSVDTACSSSLYSTHLAMEALRNGDCDMAFSAGVNMMFSPIPFAYLCQLQALSADGKCRSFDASASGYVRSEGCGMVLLKRLSDAQRDGDPILAVLKASAVNHDGASRGLTVPRASSQRAVMHSALLQAELKSSEIDFVESHGTGTPLGDPIEMDSITKVYAQDRDKQLWVGSVKSNLGHLESAAGIASIIKSVLSLERESFPANLHFNKPNPKIEWDNIPVSIPTETQTLNKRPQPYRIAVNSFGISGSNANIIIEQAPKESRLERVPRREELLLFSAHNKRSLDLILEEFRKGLDENSRSPLYVKAQDLALGRTHFPYRLAIQARNTPELIKKIDFRKSSGKSVSGFPGIYESNSGNSKLAWIFSGYGAHYFGMGKSLYEEEELFRSCIDKLAEHWKNDIDLLDLLYGNPNASYRMEEVLAWQACTFSIQCALLAWYKSLGVKPDIITGQSFGMYAASVAAGCLDMLDAADLIMHRARLVEQLPLDGAMLSVQGSTEKVHRILQNYDASLFMAITQGSDHCTLSGEQDSITQVIGDLQKEGLKCKELLITHAFHCPMMDEIVEEMNEFSQSLKYDTGHTPLILDLNGTQNQLDPEYWSRHLTQQAHFDQVLDSVQAQCGIIMEIGPAVSVCSVGEQYFPKNIWIPSLNRENSGKNYLSPLGELYAAGIEINWNKIFPVKTKNHAGILPNYPFERQKLWMNPNAFLDSNRKLSVQKSDSDKSETNSATDFLGSAVPLAKGGKIYHRSYSLLSDDWLAGHQVDNRILLPAALYVQMAREAAEKALPGRVIKLSNLEFGATLKMESRNDSENKVELYTHLNFNSRGSGEIQVYSSSDEDDKIQVHLSTEFEEAALNELNLMASLGISPAQLGRKLKNQESAEAFYLKTEQEGFNYQGLFRGINGIRFTGKEFLSEIQSAKNHPASLDSLFQTALRSYWESEHIDGDRYVTLRIGKYLALGNLADASFGYFKRKGRDEETILGDLRVCNPDGDLIALFENCEARAVSQQSLNHLTDKQSEEAGDRWLAELLELNLEGREGFLQQQIKIELAKVLGILEWEHLPLQKPLREMGVDSLMNARLVNALNTGLNLELPQSIYMEHDHVEALARYIAHLPALQDQIDLAAENIHANEANVLVS
jgi:myxalamid-type polyketide synthase MxaB